MPCDLLGYCVTISRRNHLIHDPPRSVHKRPFAEIDMQSQRQLRVFESVKGGFGRRLMSHHEAGAGNDALLMRPDDSLIDTWAQPKIIRIDDEVSTGVQDS